MDEHSGLRVIDRGNVRPAHRNVQRNLRPAHIFLVPYLGDAPDEPDAGGGCDGLAADHGTPLSRAATYFR